jgi:hypothetical protein
MSNWSKEFDDPIPTPDGGTIRTLRNAADYIQELPKADQTAAHWNVAVEMLINAAEGRGPVMYAQIAVTKALGADTKSAPQAPIQKLAKK